MSYSRSSLHVLVAALLFSGCSTRASVTVVVDGDGGGGNGGESGDLTVGLGGHTARSVGGSSHLGGSSPKGSAPSSIAGAGSGGQSEATPGGTSSSGGASSTPSSSSTSGGMEAIGGSASDSSGGTSSVGGSSGGTDVPLSCDGVSGQWLGCEHTGCHACTKLLTDYPYYFARHLSCIPKTDCGGTGARCSDNCPTPTEEDRTGGPECRGATNGWSGCLGTGCAVCSGKLTNYPKYITNHPHCIVNPYCGTDTPAACSSNCPEPTNADK